jgi:molecular chaperone IbpA
MVCESIAYGDANFDLLNKEQTMNAVSRITWPRASFVGFDRIWNELDTALTNSVDNTNVFPRHNIVKVSDTSYLIELALAGYEHDDLNVELEEGVLVISGEKEDSEVEYLHKGISTKKFRRTFRLNENVEVKEAKFTNGMLTVELAHIVPEEKQALQIDIK